MAERIGVYVCHCGSNIAATVDVEEVTRWAGTLGGIAVARDYKFMCSSLGQAMVEDDISKLGLDRIVVAACSPHLHERTFRRACANAGLNPFLLQMANIREYVSWVTRDKQFATEKVKALIAGAVARVKHHRALEPMPVHVDAHTLVLGGGIAGIQAALELADAGYPVYLVEREPSIGGHMAQYDKTFPTLDCAACILTPRMSEVGQHENIKLLTYSELEEVTGSVGNFHVRIRRKARYVVEDKCTGCGLCIEKCPRKVVDDVFEAGMGYRKSIIRPSRRRCPRFRSSTARRASGSSGASVGPARNSVRQGPWTSTKRTRSWWSTWAISFWPRDGSCSTAGAFRSTGTAGWPTCSPAWSSSGCATLPARRGGGSCCATE